MLLEVALFFIFHIPFSSEKNAMAQGKHHKSFLSLLRISIYYTNKLIPDTKTFSFSCVLFLNGAKQLRLQSVTAFKQTSYLPSMVRKFSLINYRILQCVVGYYDYKNISKSVQLRTFY